MTFPQGRWRLLAFGAALGGLSALGQAPYDLPLVLLAGLTAAVWAFRHMDTPTRATLFGWAFGAGYFAHALQWIVSPFMVDVARHGWMAPFAVVLLAAGLALFWAAAFALARVLDPKGAWPLILTLPAVELVRAYIFTGFPWAMPAQSLVDTILGQGLAWVGAHGLNVVLMALAVGLAMTANTAPRRVARYGVVLFALGAVMLPPMQPDAALTDRVIRLVQPNAAQRDKWDPEKIPVFFDRQLEYTAEMPAEGDPPPDLVLWSETAIPWRLDYAGPALEQIVAAAGGVPVALGVQRAEGEDYFNALILLNEAGEVAATYDKHHLVPFGEYVPFAGLLNRIGIFGLAQQLPAGYAAGPGPRLIDLGPLGQALPLICYEAVFASDVNAAPSRPDFLIQITNDAWFGKGAGPRQHLAQARMRAIEQGLPLARSANTGISAMIDPRGRVTASLPLNSAGFVDAPLPAPLPPTFYSRTGDWPVGLLLLAGLALSAFRIRRVYRLTAPRQGE